MRRGTVSRDQIIVDGLPVDLVGPALCTPSPSRSDVVHRPDVVAAAATVLPPSGALVAAITDLLPSRLSGEGVIDALVACDRLRALIDSRQVELLAELRKRDPHGEEFRQDEVGMALHLAPGAAAERLETASELTGRLWDTFELVRAGRAAGRPRPPARVGVPGAFRRDHREGAGTGPGPGVHADVR